MFEFIFCLLYFESVFAVVYDDLGNNQTLGNWNLGAKIKTVIPLEPPGFIIFFKGVRSPSVDDPIIGYKLVIKELSTDPLDLDTAAKNKIKNIDDVIELMQRKVTLAHLFTTAYRGSPFEIEIPVIYNEYMYRVRVVDVQPKVQYSITVQAYTKALEGPVSKPTRGYIDGRGHDLLKHHKKPKYIPAL